MSETTNIEWANSTFNPWIGCTKVSPGCKNCYAAVLDENRFSKTMDGGTKDNPVSHWGKGAPRHRTKSWNKPRQWDVEVSAHPDYRTRVFPSLCDWLDEEVPIEWLADFLKLIHDTPNLDWLLLTKRPENFTRRLNATIPKEVDSAREYSHWIAGWVNGDRMPSNVWIGVSVEDQKRADERIPLLLQIPAKVRFLSVEPLLESISFEQIRFDENGCQDCEGFGLCEQCKSKLHWVIAGGESGKDRRDCGERAIISVAQQCQAAGVPCFVKQDCAFKPGQQGRIPAEIWKLKQFPTK